MKSLHCVACIFLLGLTGCPKARPQTPKTPTFKERLNHKDTARRLNTAYFVSTGADRLCTFEGPETKSGTGLARRIKLQWRGYALAHCQSLSFVLDDGVGNGVRVLRPYWWPNQDDEVVVNSKTLCTSRATHPHRWRNRDDSITILKVCGKVHSAAKLEKAARASNPVPPKRIIVDLRRCTRRGLVAKLVADKVVCLKACAAGKSTQP